VKATSFLAFALILASPLAACDKVVTYEPPPEQRVMESEKKSFDDAKSLAAKGDLDGAHGKLSEINIAAPARQTPEFLDIETRWAKAHIAKADAEKDAQKKIAILQDVANATSVPGDLRAQASNKIAAATPDPAIPPILVNYDPEVAAANVAKVKELLNDKKMKEAKAIICPRVIGKISSPDERQLCVEICAGMKDKQCLKDLEDAGALEPGSADKFLAPPPKIPKGLTAPSAKP
jgi:hypothetical protein